jgi:hypothetical protein
MMITYIFTQTATRAIRDLPHKIIGAGFIIESIRLSWMENFVEIVAKKPKGIIK